MSEHERGRAREAIRQHVLARCAALGLATGSVIAAYQPLRTEPGSVGLLAELLDCNYQIIVPKTLPNRDLDWVPWTGPASAAPPAAPSAPEVAGLGVDAIAATALILVPAFAVDQHGNRLGRGGGSYDRALSRARPGTPVAALLYQGELLDSVPTDPWDRAVTDAVTPRGWIELTPSGRRNSR
jgi:5-formyltetrahydrofolate cyclo-ligase